MPRDIDHKTLKRFLDVLLLAKELNRPVTMAEVRERYGYTMDETKVISNTCRYANENRPEIPAPRLVGSVWWGTSDMARFARDNGLKSGKGETPGWTTPKVKRLFRGYRPRRNQYNQPSFSFAAAEDEGHTKVITVTERDIASAKAFPRTTAKRLTTKREPQVINLRVTVDGDNVTIEVV